MREGQRAGNFSLTECLTIYKIYGSVNLKGAGKESNK
jgi:hypothetical protein